LTVATGTARGRENVRGGFGQHGGHVVD